MNTTDNFQHPEDRWYQIIPLGTFYNAHVGIDQVITPGSAAQIVADFNAKYGQPNSAGLLIGHDHFEDMPDKDSTAYGWATKLELRPDGIYAQIRWTGTGQKAVDAGDYRFFSPVFLLSDFVEAAPGKNPPQMSPTRLSGLTLTNSPNMTGGKPITNRCSPLQSIMNTSTLTPRVASAELKRLAQAHAGQAKISFSDAYNVVRQANPELALTANRRDDPDTQTIIGRHFNRLVESQSSAPNRATPVNWNDQVAAQMSLAKQSRWGTAPAPAQNRQSAGPSYPGELYDLARAIQVKHQLPTFNAAWNRAKQENPEKFARV